MAVDPLHPADPPSPRGRLARRELVLHLDGVTVVRHAAPRPVRSLDEVSLTVEAGEMVALMGPSGSGKTTVVQVGCGLIEPTMGALRLRGSLVPPDDRLGWAQRRRQFVGVVHQRLDLLAGLSVLDNVALPLLLDQSPVRRAHGQAKAALTRVGMADAARRMPRDLSGGEQQRVAIARAVVGNRRLLLADEPTAALDTATAEGVVELLATLARDGTAVLMATHDSRMAGWADRVVFLRDGRVTNAPAAALTGTAR